MGIKGSATCVLNFDEAKAWRLGPKPQPKEPGQEKKKSSSAGMSGMFGMMNMARLGVGVQGFAIAEAAYQNGLAYAHERRVGRAPGGDVRRLRAPQSAAIVVRRRPELPD